LCEGSSSERIISFSLILAPALDELIPRRLAHDDAGCLFERLDDRREV
jgi:hypothetical protein